MPEIYVIVADSSKARVLYSTSKSSPLSEIAELNHPEGRMHTRDLTSDLPGRDSDRAGQGKHRMDSATDPKHNGNIEFARDLTAYLEKLIRDNTVDQLMIVAPPTFLGILRNQFPQTVANEVSFELDKNLMQYNPGQLRSYLPYFKPVERLMT